MCSSLYQRLKSGSLSAGTSVHTINSPVPFFAAMAPPFRGGERRPRIPSWQPSPPPGAEEPRSALGAPLRGLDAKSRSLHGTLGVAIGMTSPHDLRPHGLDDILEARAPGSRGAHVLQHAQLTAGPQHALDLLEAGTRIAYAAEREPAQHRVEAL